MGLFLIRSPPASGRKNIPHWTKRPTPTQDSKTMHLQRDTQQTTLNYRFMHFPPTATNPGHNTQTFTIKSDRYTEKPTNIAQYAPQEDAPHTPRVIHKNFSGISGGRKALALLNKQKQELRGDTNVRAGPAQCKQRLYGLRRVTAKLKARTHLLFDNRNYRATHGSDQQIMHIQGLLCGQVSAQKKDNGG